VYIYVRCCIINTGVCLVVGSCARGFDPAKNTGGDIIYANSPVIKSSDNGDVGIQVHSICTYKYYSYSAISINNFCMHAATTAHVRAVTMHSCSSLVVSHAIMNQRNSTV
jgi:hypothetical protein